MAVTLAACSGSTSSGQPTSAPSTVVTPTQQPTTPAPTSTAPTPTPATTSASPSDTPTTSAPPTSATPTSDGNECSLPTLGVSVQRGGASLGHEIAIVQFTNNGNSACDLSGYAGAVLQRNGRTLGQPAGRDKGKVATVTIPAGGTAQAMLSVSTSCQAQLSDKVRITPPGGGYVDAPLALRGCPMTIGPIEPSQ